MGIKAAPLLSFLFRVEYYDYNEIYERNTMYGLDVNKAFEESNLENTRFNRVVFKSSLRMLLAVGGTAAYTMGRVQGHMDARKYRKLFEKLDETCHEYTHSHN